MSSVRYLSTLLLFATARSVDDDQSAGNLEHAKCHMTPAYPPDADTKLTEYVIDMDISPEQRWTEPITALKTEINKLVELVTGSKLVSAVVNAMDHDIDEYLDLFPKEYGKELKGIATVLDKDVGDVFLYNIAYELFGLCTSIVAQDDTGLLSIE